jgi:hypothetical protein
MEAKTIHVDDLNGRRTPEHVLASVPGEKRLTVSIVIDREDPGSVIVYRAFNKHERVREVYKQTPPMVFRY